VRLPGRGLVVVDPGDDRAIGGDVAVDQSESAVWGGERTARVKRDGTAGRSEGRDLLGDHLGRRTLHTRAGVLHQRGDVVRGDPSDELGLNALDNEYDPCASLPTVLSWSLRRLAPEQRTVFALLGISPGPDIGLPVTVSLTGLPIQQTGKVLSALEAASLLTRQSGGRYAMHDLIRDYAATTSRSEHANLLASQHTANTHGWYYTAWLLAWSLTTFLYRQGHLHDRLSVWQAALDAAAHLPDPAIRIRTHRRLSRPGTPR
jgi:hypothetical protein